MSSVSDIYDALFSFEAKKKSGAYPIHKKVTPEGLNLLDWISREYNVQEGMHILDAGCGTGNTLFHFNRLHPISGLGLSLSDKEVAYAKAESERLGTPGIRFLKRDYTTDLQDIGPFDLIICIESLKHTRQPEKAIENFLDRLHPGGSLVIVDDFLTGKRVSDKKLKTHKTLWNAPGFISIEQVESLLSETFEAHPQTIDMSHLVPVKNPFKRLMMSMACWLMRWFYADKSTMRTNLDTYRGGLLLEDMYVYEQVGYYTIRIRKKAI